MRIDRGGLLSRYPILDLLGLAGAIAYGLPSLLYPFGLDQSLFAYIADGWLHGGWPYVDSLDHKPPGIYLIYALATLVGGSWQGAIRLLELIALPLFGWMIIEALRGSQQRRDGELGATVLLLSGFYYTCFGYWEGGQVEFWEALLLVAALLIALRCRSLKRMAIFSGALAGSAFLFKYPAIIPTVGIAGVCAWRSARSVDSSPGPHSATRRTMTTLFTFGLSATGPIVLILVAFAARGSLSEFWDATVLFNLRYSHLTVEGPMPLGAFFAELVLPYSVAFVLLLLFGVVWYLRRRGGVAGREAGTLWTGVWGLAMLALAFASVAAQRKFWFYHYVILMPFAVMVMVWALRLLLSWRTRWMVLIAAVAVMAGIAASPKMSANRYRVARMAYREHVARSWEYIRGRASRDELLRAFVFKGGFEYLRSEHMGEVIREKARPGDTLCVFGFNPIIYWVSGLRCSSRFVTTHVLAGAYGNHRDGAWRREYEEALRVSPPTFLLVRYDLVPLMNARGYQTIQDFGGTVLLERAG